MSLQPPQRVTGPFRDVIEYLLDHPDGAHGYVLWNDTGLQSATVYRVLSRLVAAGWAELPANGGRHGGPERQVFTLTNLGRAGSTAVLARHRGRRRTAVPPLETARVPHQRAKPQASGAPRPDTPVDTPALAAR